MKKLLVLLILVGCSKSDPPKVEAEKTAPATQVAMIGVPLREVEASLGKDFGFFDGPGTGLRIGKSGDISAKITHADGVVQKLELNTPLPVSDNLYPELKQIRSAVASVFHLVFDGRDSMSQLASDWFEAATHSATGSKGSTYLEIDVEGVTMRCGKANDLYFEIFQRPSSHY